MPPPYQMATRLPLPVRSLGKIRKQQPLRIKEQDRPLQGGPIRRKQISCRRSRQPCASEARRARRALSSSHAESLDRALDE
jgi:hypothetical protein